MINLIGVAPESHDYRQGHFIDFLKWLDTLTEVEFDIETNVTPWWCDKKLITMQFGWDNTQWVIQWSELSEQAKLVIKHRLENRQLRKYIHNAIFECVVCLFHGIRILNVYDTMLAEMVLKGGEHLVEYGLDDCCLRYLGIYLDKTEQTTFGDNILTEDKVRYAAQDVQWLFKLRQKIEQSAVAAGYDSFDVVVKLENDIVPAFAEMTFNGMELDKEWWLNLAAEATPLVEAAKLKLDEWLRTPEFEFTAYALNYISNHDKILINWNSPKQKNKIFAELFPQIPGGSKAVVKKWQSDALKSQQMVPEWIPYYLDGDFTMLEKELLETQRQWLIENELLIPAGVAVINWNSTDQVLPLIQCVEPKLKNLDKEAKGRCSHPILIDLDNYLDTKKLLTTYGDAFIYGSNEPGKKERLPSVEPDGKVRTRFLQILTTGRISSSKPNMQNIPAKEEVGNKYRNAFVPGTGWSFVSSDYISQELIVVAYLSKDPVWAEALTKGQDLHSVAAELVFGKKWRDASDNDCAYYKMTTDSTGHREYAKVKCKCKGHKFMRTGCKTVNFGLIYGMSEFKLAGTLRIKVPEAKKLIADYFKAFPEIGKLLEYLGRFGVEKGYIQTIRPYWRRRWFPEHQFFDRFIGGHLSGAQYHDDLGSIERAAKNQPIQGTSADMMKDSMRRVFYHIFDNNLFDKVKMKMQVHDQLDTAVIDSYAATWAPVQTKLLEDAALVSIPTGILKADTQITLRWAK